jgi:hypothetical protein
MKINWGWRIAMLYIGFLALMLFLVYKTTLIKDDLVSKDYYTKELKFQEQLDKQRRTKQLFTPLTWHVEGRNIGLQFPDEVRDKKVNATILFYKANDARQDFSVYCSPDSNGLCTLPTQNLSKGAYQMQIDWKAGDISYYNEGTVNIE